MKNNIIKDKLSNLEIKLIEIIQLILIIPNDFYKEQINFPTVKYIYNIPSDSIKKFHKEFLQHCKTISIKNVENISSKDIFSHQNIFTSSINLMVYLLYRFFNLDSEIKLEEISEYKDKFDKFLYSTYSVIDIYEQLAKVNSYLYNLFIQALLVLNLKEKNDANLQGILISKMNILYAGYILSDYVLKLLNKTLKSIDCSTIITDLDIKQQADTFNQLTELNNNLKFLFKEDKT